MPTPATEPAARAKLPARTLPSALAVAISAGVTFSVYGYQFGNSNHGVYLLDALRKVDPALLRNDWFLTSTLQYHILFTYIAAALMRMKILAPAFVGIYLAMIVMLHIAWRGIVIYLGGRNGAYLISVALYYLSAGGTGLGMYQFLQDSSVLPSNIAGIALLWGLWMWLIDRRAWAGVWVGIAGIFHLNFALVGIGLWVVLALWRPVAISRLKSKDMLLGSAAAIIPSAMNILFAMQSKLSASNAMPLERFVELYVRLRHPHHYDPSSWPAGIWVAFMWTIIPALVLLRGPICRIYQVFLGLIVVALLGAGFWYVSETLIQMSLYRFSIYLQLFGCAAAGVLVERSMGMIEGQARRHDGTEARREEGTTETRRLSPLRAFVPTCLPACPIGFALCAAIITISILRGPFFGLFQMPKDDPEYRRLCEWVSVNTPVDAVFLVPPDEESMRLVGRRAIVVNFKCVPQLSAELSAWAARMEDVLDLRDITTLPQDYRRVLPEIRTRYEAQPAAQLSSIAAKYNARYIVSTRELPGHESQRVPVDGAGQYLLYDLTR